MAERFGHKSQATLFDCFQRSQQLGRCPADCGGDCNPANPPGASSHEQLSDGSGFPGPSAASSQWWELGLDVEDSDKLLAILGTLGYQAKRTYPSNPKEFHHLNFTADPGPVLPTRRPRGEARPGGDAGRGRRAQARAQAAASRRWCPGSRSASPGRT